jgi:hypothetical protein
VVDIGVIHRSGAHKYISSKCNYSRSLLPNELDIRSRYRNGPHQQERNKNAIPLFTKRVSVLATIELQKSASSKFHLVVHPHRHRLSVERLKKGATTMAPSRRNKVEEQIFCDVKAMFSNFPSIKSSSGVAYMKITQHSECPSRICLCLNV